jgi:hypothetical protein
VGGAHTVYREALLKSFCPAGRSRNHSRQGFLKQVTLQERLYDAEPTAGLLFNLLEKHSKEFLSGIKEL